MFYFARKRPDGPGVGSGPDRPRARRPVIIGFEQLEGRDLMSTGLALTIIPDPSGPITTMPRPFVGSFNPESPTASRVSMTPRAVDGERVRPWSPWGRSRRRGLDRG